MHHSRISHASHTTTLRRKAGAVLLLAALLLGLLPGAVLPAVAQSDPVLFPSPTPTSGLVLPTVTPTPPRDLPDSAAPAALSAAPGELLVGVRESAAPAVAASFGQIIAANAQGMGIDAAAVATLRTFDVGSPTDDLVTQLVAVPAGKEYDVAMLLASVPGVVYVEPNGLVEPAQFPMGQAEPPAGYAINDPLYAEQWHTQRAGFSRAWQLAFSSNTFDDEGDQVRVAVLDSGIDAQHPEFAGRIVQNVSYAGDPNVDSCGHGTHVAGLVGAALNNKLGGAGGAPTVQLDIRRVFGATCSGTISSVAEALRDAADAGADIINLSMQVSSNYVTLQLAVEYALAQGSLLVAASGNYAQSVLAWPAAYPGVLAVGALTIDDEPAWYSNSGPGLSLAAPGGTLDLPIWSTWSRDKINPNTGGVSCASNSPLVGTQPPYYCTQYGTSQAAAVVSGAAALLLSLQPSLTITDVKSILIESATPLSASADEVGAGKLNVETAVRALLPATLKSAVPAIYVESAGDGSPYTQTLRFDAESSQIISWTASLEIESVTAAAPLTNTDAIKLAGEHEGTATWGRPVFLTLSIDPSLVNDSLAAAVHLQTIDSSGLEASNTVPVATLSVWLPLVRRSPGDASLWAADTAPPDFEWLEPANPEDRTLYAMEGLTDTLVSLPFIVDLDGEQHSDLLIHADGFVTLPAAIPPTATPGPPADNLCLPATAWPDQAVYGWWADLNPAAADATVSTFALGNRFVVEFADVPAVNVEQPYEVSFQIVLGQDGGVLINYLETPSFVGRPERATVGVESRRGRFWSQVACANDEFVFDLLPRSGQTLVIDAEEIF